MIELQPLTITGNIKTCYKLTYDFELCKTTYYFILIALVGCPCLDRYGILALVHIQGVILNNAKIEAL